MSNWGQAVLTIAGTVIGSYFGYPQLGFLLGSMAGSVAFPTQLPTIRGPKIDDLAVQGSSIGTPVPLVYGAFRVAGNIIWSSDLIATTTSEEVGGKGGPTQTVETTTYSVNFAVGLCGNQITGVRRVWAGGKLIYDRRPQLSGEPAAEYNARLDAADAADTLSTLYLGTETQLPDPTIESYEGLGNVPAYRELAYIVFRDFQLADYGNNLAGTMLSFEVISGGALGFQEVITYAPEYIAPFLANPNLPFTEDNDNDIVATIYRLASASHSQQQYLLSSVSRQSATAAISYLAGMGNLDSSGHPLKPVWPLFNPLTSWADPDNYITSTAARTNIFVAVDTTRKHRCSVFYYPLATEDIKEFLHMADIPGATLAAKLTWLRTTGGLLQGEVAYIEDTPGASDESPSPYQSLYQWGLVDPPPADEMFNWDGTGGFYDGGQYWFQCFPIIVTGVRIPRTPDPPCHPRAPAEQPPIDDPYIGFCLINGVYNEDVAWAFQDGNDPAVVMVLQRYATRVGYREQVEPMLHVSDANFSSQAFWEARYAAAVAAGLMPAALTYDGGGMGDYPFIVTNETYWKLTNEQSFISAELVTLDVIVADLCRRSGLTAAQFDVDQLIIPLVGYAVGRVMDAASAIMPLRGYGFFDMVESDGALKYITRGGVSVASLAVDDLAAHQSDAERPTAIEVVRAQDVDLPRGLRVKYLMADKDYEPGEQVATRLRTTANQFLDVELPIAMTDVLAAQIADISLYEAWMGRNSYTFALSQKHLALEPTDPVEVPVDGELQRVRIVAEDFSIPGIKQVQAIRDGGLLSYLSYASGGAPLIPEQTIRTLDSTLALYLDLPLLREADSNAGYYAALHQVNSFGLWPGGIVLRSADGGGSYFSVGTATIQSVAGFLVDPLPAGATTVVDFTHVLLVSLDLDTQALASITAASLLVGGNAAAIGVDGRWEVIQFRSAVLTGATDGKTWALTGLARGRRGTEYVMGTSLAGDRFVLLGNVIRISQEIAAIGAERSLKAITVGQASDAGTPVLFTGNGEALEPISPVWVAGSRAVGGDLTITWVRRSRFGQELPSGVDLPLGEETEAYDVDVLAGSLVVRTVTVTVASWVYTAANQQTDFGSPIPGAVTVRIFQRSAVVGRGHPAEATI